MLACGARSSSPATILEARLTRDSAPMSTAVQSGERAFTSGLCLGSVMLPQLASGKSELLNLPAPSCWLLLDAGPPAAPCSAVKGLQPTVMVSWRLMRVRNACSRAAAATAAVTPNCCCCVLKASSAAGRDGYSAARQLRCSHHPPCRQQGTAAVQKAQQPRCLQVPVPSTRRSQTLSKPSGWAGSARLGSQ